MEKRTWDLLYKDGRIKKSEERYRKMAEEVEDYAILLLDKEGTIVNWNKGAEKIKGYEEGGDRGQGISGVLSARRPGEGLPLQLLQLAREEGRRYMKAGGKERTAVFSGAALY